MAVSNQLLVDATIDRVAGELGRDALEQAHMARVLRRLGRHRLAASIEAQLLEAGGYSVHARGAGSLAELAAGPVPGTAVWEWLRRLGEKVGLLDETPPEIL